MRDIPVAWLTGSKGFTVIDSTDVAATDYPFYAIQVVSATAAIEEITFPANLAGYTGDADIVGKTLQLGQTYQIFGDSIKLSSGTVIAYHR